MGLPLTGNFAILKVRKIKLPLEQAVEAHRIGTLRCSHFIENPLKNGFNISPTRHPFIVHKEGG